MTRHSSRYLNADESASLNWLEQSNIFNASQSGEYEGNLGEVAADEGKGGASQSHNFPSTIFLPYSEQTSPSEHGLEDKSFVDDEERRVLLAITVEVEDGHLEYIEIRDGDCAESAATKFCETHLLPEKYVAPLTEHIVEEVHRISKVDKSIRFASQDGMVHTDDAASTQELQNTDKYWASEGDAEFVSDVDKGQECGKDPLNQENHERMASKSLSESLLSPTFTSRAKSQNGHQVDVVKEPRKKKQLSEQAKAVYMRLYGEFLRQKQRIEEEKRWCEEQYKQRIERDKPVYSKKTRRIMKLRGRAAKQFQNYGELLYREGLNKEEEKRKMIQKRLQEDKDKELSSLTLKPEISKLAKQLKRVHGPVWDRLLNEKPRNDLQELRQEVWEAKFMECTFRPRVNQRPPEEDDDLTYSRFDQLFWDAENRRRRQAEYDLWYPEGVTFRPIINGYNKGPGMIDDQGNYNQGNVFERLTQYAARLTEKKKKLLKSHESGLKGVDSSTGQRLFRPKIGRKPHAERNTSALPIGEFLYRQKFEIENKRKTMAAKDRRERRELAKGHYVGPRSQKLLNRAKQRKFHKIFDYLDKDKDGFIDIDPTELKQLPEDVFGNTIDLSNLENLDKKHISFQEFLELLNNVQKDKKGSSYLDSRSTKKLPNDIENYSFEFKMDQNSRDLANRKRRFSSRYQWYKMILRDRAKWQTKVEDLRKEKQKAELAECTFRPSIQPFNPRSHIVLTDSNVKNVSIRDESPSRTGDKDLREVHAFIFQEAAIQNSDLGQEAIVTASVGLLESFDNVSNGLEKSEGELE